MKFENSVSRRSFIVGAAGVATLGLAACGGNGAKKEDAAGGEKKADAIYGLVEGPVTPDLPASILQRHPDVTLLLDKAAAAKLHL